MQSPFRSIPTSLALGAALLIVIAPSGCTDDPTDGPKNGALDNSPSGALRKAIFAAQSKDEAGFKATLSRNFTLTLDEYQKLELVKPKLKGAFSVAMFMQSLAATPGTPREEILKPDNKAIVKSVAADGTTFSTKMILEKGQWKLEVPDRIAYLIGHPDELEKIAMNKKSAPEPKLTVGGGGKGGRLKALAADATAEAKLKAEALDAFDLGALSGIEDKLKAALVKNPADDELVVALGRAHVQKGNAEDAVKVFEKQLAQKPDAVRVLHYAGMAFLMNKRFDEAAKSWRKIIKLDPTYAKKHTLERRAAVAETMAKGGDTKSFGMQDDAVKKDQRAPTSAPTAP